MITARKRLKNTILFSAFMTPSLIVFITVMLIPFIYGFFLTFTDYNPIAGNYSFVGLRNFSAVFFDKEFTLQFTKTLGYVFFSSIFCNILAFFLAYLLTSKMKGRNFLRAGFFTPNLIGGIVLGYIWRFLFANVFTQVGKTFGIDSLSTSFLTDPNRAILALSIVTVWQYAGYLMTIYVAGFLSMPNDILEAAEIDGAVGMKKLSKITIPMMVPSVIICFFITISRGFMAYDLNLALTNGDPYGSSQLAAMHIYQKAFQANQYGIGQAEAIVLFIAVAAVAVSQVLLVKKFEVEA
jgi:raffinose/stachyose/melibiose transport system permease protein